MSDRGNGKLAGVQAARGIAALLVTAFHCQAVISLPEIRGTPPFGGFFAFGHAGVDFFFVLSGFIILHVHRGDLDKPERLPTYLWKRVTRIYPLFLFVMIFYTAKYILSGDFDWSFFIKSALLLPQGNLPLLMQSWTLVHEMLFYTVFGLAIMSRRLALLGIALWVPASIWVHWYAPDLGRGFVPDLVTVVASPYNLLFLIGMFVAWWTRTLQAPFPRSVILGGVAAFLATGMAENAGLLQHGTLLPIALFGVSAGIMLTGLIAGERSGQFRLGRLANLLGDISYPLYLIHGAVISVAISAALALNVPGPDWLLLPTILAIASAAALLLNRLVERPMASALQNRWRRLTNPYTVGNH